MSDADTKARAPVERLAPDTIRLTRILNAPAEQVWRYLTEAELRRQWFMDGTDPVAASEFELTIDHDNLSQDAVPYPDNYAAMKGKRWTEKVIRFEPPHLLETTFGGGDSGIVTYQLEPQGERTRLILTHSGISSDTGPLDFGSGWTSHLAVLEARLAGGGIKDFWALHSRSREAVKVALA